ncbi:protein SENSITIVITY TO RED LIGHT REDUCED 1 [Ricinus communis]|uniref:protein SENSITIVITY TO RED LIGHT REDUCED 1 n=1 Tax=Ricinus communis TaxID=3988 RepID=UPI00201B0081|nr:protein SENSITIVITY TO RED LIGHT REDUCED 1 [Ricinus communis]XP_015575818.2 protein SENSITIVITY TO RED LIGHT REDUCED 1 [Ricinus communis]XP_015575819.2 protein SENSITIVITY TO RED LIGHT REDUCED 1 [Ricinus communis]XP_015575821.2 protein SENSITIVITY TO RED LIGHT REDUCED 1 [Ricinus communis]XP_015575822.2 protein SENSITIVITY TO RED LIGHT REDUCED 1 [Ricinus communis]XP_025013428.2 protein SENSITIVITY TO RED LIGHT REDUCED 1 [Ricinus communis]XP_025013430.2 protein SENSITIVITY TO RED LIGHT REDUC
MDASAKILTVDNHTCNGEWTVVLPRGKRSRNFSKIRTPEEQQQPWVPADLESDSNRQSKLIEKMNICMKKVENSQFYQTLLEQIQTPESLDSFHKVLGSELKMQMVIYGIGSIESYETPRIQLSVAILMKKEFSWIGDIEVFDPVLSATESRVLEALGCSVLSVNEHGRRCVTRPTLFYMPHCEAELYNNLLQANWRVELLNRIALFGNSFEVYQYLSEFRNSTIVDSSRHIVAVREFTHEYVIKTVSDDYFAAFHDSSWHFFSPDPKTELQLFNN